MYEDYDMECWKTKHLKWTLLLDIPSLFCWGALAPFLAFRLLKKNKNNLDDEAFKGPYGFLYLGYKNEKYYWEFIILYRKIIMIFISVFMASYNVDVQAICVLGVGFISYNLHISSNPFLEDDLNDLEKRSLMSATFTIYCGCYYL
jgi:hypothetical protein